MTSTIGSKAARIVSDGFHMFAYKPIQLTTLIMPEVFLLQMPMSPDAIEVFRTFRIGGGKLRHDKSNISFDMIDGSIVLSEIFLTPDFGISVVADPDMARFEFMPAATRTDFPKLFQFKTMDGFVFEPRCFFKVI
ncbi:MAG: hypothetical protein HYX67_08315 [Candidatus Melainabacteria bacterium]|nr:hypothetical protein [Candidatus Melainabacteria bacterium]